MKCKKCNTEKPNTEFQTYYHSTQNINRTRKQCNLCFNEAKKQSRILKKMKICIKCGENKLKNEFYDLRSLTPNDKRRSICKVCTILYVKTKQKKYRGTKEERGEPVLNKPNTYRNQEQKEDGFAIMEALGFTFVEETGRWHKEGFRNPDGTFVRIEERNRLIDEKNAKETKDMNIWESITYLREKDTSIAEISRITNLNYNTVHKYIAYKKKTTLYDKETK
jgi:hypothetical protein